jgi:uncharacterized protein YkwD
MVSGFGSQKTWLRLRAPLLIASLLAAITAAAPTDALSQRRHQAHAARTCSGANTPAAAMSRRTTKRAVVCLINRQRAAHRLPPLRQSRLLDRSAQGWTNTMVTHGFFSHGANFAARISAVGFAWTAAGENIATGFVTPRGVVRAWMGSAGHCQNILNPTYTHVGTGVLSHVVGGGRGATWTQDFALAGGRRAPSHNWGPANGCPY